VKEQKPHLFSKIDTISSKLSDRFNDSILAEKFSEVTSNLDQKQKNNVTIGLSYLFGVTPFLMLFFLLMINNHIKSKNSLFQNLESKITDIEKLNKEVRRASSSLPRHQDFSSKNKAKSYFSNALREFNLPSTAITINKIEESFVGDLKKVYLDLSFNKLGQQELSKLIKTIKMKAKATIKKLNIRTDKSTKLALGIIELELVTK